MPSQYSHGHEFDVFISYSSHDREWVERFHDDLVADVNRFTRHDIVVFFDKSRLQPGFVWEDRLNTAARSSAILVPVISTRFLESDYCQKELGAFVEAHRLTSRRAHQSCVMPVNLLCAAPSNHVLVGFQATTFFTQRDGRPPFEHAPGEALYKEALRTLAYAIAQVLNGLPPQQDRPTVYLASDFRPPSDKLRASLGHHYTVLPKRPRDLLDLPSMEVEVLLQQDFDRSFASVHVLSEPSLDSPLESRLMARQIRVARSGEKPRLVWSSERPDHLTSQGFEWFTSQSQLEDYLRRLLEKPQEIRYRVGAPLIYFICPDRANKTSAEPLLDALEKRGIRLYPSPLEGPADRAMQTHISALDELDGCLIYYGDVDRSWFDAVFPRVHRKIHQRHLPTAIFLAPPPTDHKQRDLSGLGVPLVREAEAAAQAFLGAEA